MVALAISALEYKGFSFAYPKGGRSVGPIDFAVEAGSFTVLVGNTGSGKTTALRCAKPELAPTGERSGQVLVHGEDCATLDAATSAEMVGYVSQSPDNQIVCDTVWHQMAFGLENLGTPQPEMHRRVAEVSHFLGIGTWFRKSVDELSGGQRQLLSLASVLVMRPKVMLLDEPTSQLDPVAEKDFLHALLRLNRELGLTVVVATHSPQQFLNYASDFAVLQNGTIYAVAKDDIDTYVLQVSDEQRKILTAPLNAAAGQAVVFKDAYVRHSRKNPFVLNALDLEIKRNAIHAIVGGNGSGKTTALRCAAGLMKPERGKVTNSLKSRQALLPQDPKALFVCDTVAEELREWQSACGYSDEQIQEVLERYNLNEHTAQHPYDLSGGQQQLLAFAKLELTDPDLLLLDEPTKGLDPQSRLQVACTVHGLARQGRTIVLVTHDLAFARCVTTDVTLLFDGEATCTQMAAEFFDGNLFYKALPDALTRAFDALEG